MSTIGKIIRVNALPPTGAREKNVIYQVAAPGAVTYTDYAIDENGDLKIHAVVDGTVPVELADNNVSISTPDLKAEGITNQAEYNTDTREKLLQKLDIPNIQGNAQDYPEIIGLDNNGNAAKLPAGDLGKNIANSSLTSIAGAGLTLGEDWEIKTSGKNYTISGLSDVSNDSNFNKFIAQNIEGKIGKSTGKQIFLNTPSSLTESERTAWKTAMNGGWTTNTMSVATITPPVVDKQDKNYWITIRGANLNLNPASFSVDLMANDGTTIIANIPGSQVHLSTDGLDLKFYYNYKNLPLGDYKIRLWNGVAYYITSLTISVIQNIQPVDLSTITWTKKIYNDVINDATFGNGGSAIYQSNPAVKASDAGDPTIVGALKSSKINDVGENFYLEFSVNFQHSSNLTNKAQYVGLMNNNAAIDLLDQTLTKIKTIGVLSSTTGYRSYYLDNTIVGSVSAGSAAGSNETINVIIIKSGTIMTTMVTARNATRHIVTSVPDIEYSLNMAVNNMGGSATTSLAVINLYKF